MPLKKFLLFSFIFFCISAGSFLYIQSPEKYTGKEKVARLEAQSLDKPIEFIVTGDIMLGRFVEVLMDGNGEGYPFKGLAGFLRQVHFVVGNLEGPIVLDHTPTPAFDFKFSFASSTARLLKENSISVVSLANNHALDQGVMGYKNTKELLEKMNVEYFGHPVSVGNISVLHKNIENKKITFIGLNATWPYEEKLFEDVVKKESVSGDFVVVVIHWGEEYKLTSNDEQKSLAHVFIDSGADLVVGHHPHVVQEIEMYKDRIIFYSLGNFIFDQFFSKNVMEGLLVKVSLEDEKVQYELFPTISLRSQPSVMEGNERTRFLDSLASKSSVSLLDSIRKGLVESVR
ncbi:MAG: hypothetical protein RJA61_740 [Candidatus Parcubacteria bacterium]|jgi:poly-gamma-glutamate synthesis protein (capsule biosynthesis protein)